MVPCEEPARLTLPQLLGYLFGRLENRDVGRDCSTNHVEDAAELRISDLHALRGLACKLHRRHYMHGDAGCADRVAFGLEAARWVDRQLAVLLRPTLLDGARAL